MSEIDDGVIKYERHFTPSTPLEPDEYSTLEKWRKKLFNLKLIGEYPKVCIGYGNLSQKVRTSDSIEFIITATQTGKFADLSGEHYTLVEGYDFEKNLIKAKGVLDASSEALTHASIYECSKDINVVFHIHDKEIWTKMLEQNFESTPPDVPYGTIEMVKAVRELIKGRSSGVFAMAGHEDGIVSWAKSHDEAGKLILDLVKNLRS